MDIVVTPIAGDSVFWLDGLAVSFARLGPITSGKHAYWDEGLPVLRKDRSTLHGVGDAMSYVWLDMDMGHIWAT
jgi:hypothetical protein